MTANVSNTFLLWRNLYPLHISIFSHSSSSSSPHSLMEKAADQVKSIRVEVCSSSSEDRVPLCVARRFYRNTRAWPSCAGARTPPPPVHKHTHTLLRRCDSHTNICLHPSVTDRISSKIAPWKQQMQCLTCLWYLPSLVKSQVLCLFVSLPLELVLHPSLSLPLPLFPSVNNLTLPLFLLLSAVGWTSQSVGIVPWLFSLRRSQWFFLPHCSALGQKDLILIPSGRPQTLSCSLSVSQFDIMFFFHSRAWACGCLPPKRPRNIRVHGFLHTLLYAEACVSTSEVFEKDREHWNSVREKQL